MLDGAILPGGILALQDDQKGAAARRVQQLLRIRKLSREAVQIPSSLSCHPEVECPMSAGGRGKPAPPV